MQGYTLVARKAKFPSCLYRFAPTLVAWLLVLLHMLFQAMNTLFIYVAEHESKAVRFCELSNIFMWSSPALIVSIFVFALGSAPQLSSEIFYGTGRLWTVLVTLWRLMFNTY